MKKGILLLFLLHSFLAFSQKSIEQNSTLKLNESNSNNNLPCQGIIANIDISLPLFDHEDIIRICPGETVAFEGSGDFTEDGTGATYHWDFGNGTFGTGEATTAIYLETGLYTVNLVITDANPEGCSSSNDNTIFVYVSSTPDFSNTLAVDTTICLGETTTLEGVVEPQIVVANCANNGEQAVLDDVGEYISVLDLNCFDGELLTDVSQLESICLVMEHSYLGDLEIIVTSPDGQEVVLHNRGGASFYLGDPLSTDGTGPGMGWVYCFSMDATTLLSDGPTELSGTPESKLSIQSGNYLPIGDFNDFVGTTIDGQWELKIVDYGDFDDGTIFGWHLNFEEALISTDLSFTPTIMIEAWDDVTDGSIIDTTGNIITVQPTIPGVYCYTYRATDDLGCEYSKEVCIEVFPEVTPIQPSEFQECDDDTADEETNFDLTLRDDEITGGNNNWSVSYFEIEGDAQSNDNPINPSTTYLNNSNPQTLHVRVTDNITGCVGFTTLLLQVMENPEPLTDAPNLELCDTINPGDNQEVFDLRENEAYIINNEVGVLATYYESFANAQAGSNPISNPTDYINTNTAQTIFVRVTNITTSCFTIVDFDIIVHPMPLISDITDMIICEVNADGFNAFNLESKTAEVLNGQDPTIFEVTYHETPADADTGTAPLPSPYTNISNPQTIYVNIENTITGCNLRSGAFDIGEINNPTANSDGTPIDYVLCDTFEANDGIAQFDLSSQDALVLDGQDPAQNSVSYYASPTDADLGVNALDNNFENTQNPQIIYVRVENSLVTFTDCYAITDLTLVVNLIPEVYLESDYMLCVNTNGTENVSPPLLETGLSDLEHHFEWRLNNVIINGATNSSYLVDQAGDYSVTVTSIITNCQNTANTTVTESSPPTINARVVSTVFADNNIIEVEASGSGDYEYKLDNGTWQDSNVFEDVGTGEHIISVRDINGCGLATTTVMVMDYPKYFTPNGDGYHDTWNIVGINSQPNAKIFIYDRYGKLIKQLSPLGNGWDGTFNGRIMPSSDYWFIVEYSEQSDGSLKQFKAHFSLKR